MELLDIVAALLLAACLLLLALVARRVLLRRAGVAIDVAVRAGSAAHWTVGMARLTTEGLQWFRFFSLSPRPSRTLARGEISVCALRRASAGEQLTMMTGATVLTCRTCAAHDVELAMPESAVTGFTAWVESVPPGPGVRMLRE